MILSSEEQSLQLAQQYVQSVHAPCCIYLHGELGAGKTTWVRGMLRGLGFLGRVKSPTFSVVESYDLIDCTIHHFDLYRFNDASEWFERGLDAYFDMPAIWLIEWPERAIEYIPGAQQHIYFDYLPEGREVRIV